MLRALIALMLGVVPTAPMAVTLSPVGDLAASPRSVTLL